MRSFNIAGLWIAVSVLTSSLVTLNASADDARTILDRTGLRGGFIVHVHCGDAELTTNLRASDSFQVHGLTKDREAIAAIRERLLADGTYGNVAIDHFDGKKLPYIENMVNLVVVDELGDLTRQEIERVLTPGGFAYLGSGSEAEVIRKPVPAEIDDWTHYLYDPSNNAVAHDTVVGPPKRLQWLGTPRWSRHHDRMASMSAMVTTEGRIFYVMDEGSRVSIQLPPDWKLIARDAFNGVVLWKRSIPDWQSHLWPLKSGPTQLARRLVSVGDRVYLPLGFEAPLTQMDAATGEIIRTYENTKSTEEVIVEGDTIFALVNEGESELADYRPQFNTGDQGRVAREFAWNAKPRHVVAIRAETGEELWRHESVVSPLSMMADNERVFFYDGEKIVCLDRKSGQEVWASEPAARRNTLTFNFGPRLVLYNDVVLFAGGDRTMRSLDAATGEILWTAPHARSGYQSPEDLLVVDGLVWSAPTTSGRDSGNLTGRDPRTGEVKVEFPPNVSTYWFHHRCYIAKATDNFIMMSRTGVEFVDFRQNDWVINHWVRGGCLYGIMPANGLIYAPPHNCACYPEAKLYGLNALAAESDWKPPIKVEDENRLTKGPAFGHEGSSRRVSPTDWPTYRGNNNRSGATSARVPTELATAWETKLDGRLSAVSIAAGKLFVAQVDQHTLHALDAASGERLWHFTTGGRVDSPPTYHNGTVIFGSADGHVYCLRAEDGELVWRFRAAPEDRRHMVEEQLESIWPVHGTVLVEEGIASFVAGRSLFLDGGIRFIQIDAQSGELVHDNYMDNTDPDTGKDLQERLQVLQMPVGLPDILSSDGAYIYMRSQQFDKQGRRVELGPNSGDFAGQGSVQRGETAHLFSPTGYLDGTYFHRSYWVFGRSFAGGHAGYYQAGKFAPAGRLLVHNKDKVYGFGRKPEYLRWTTPLEHWLFASDKEPPEVVAAGAGSQVAIENKPSLDPTGKPVAISAWVKAERPNGVILARGGPENGYALILDKGKPSFIIRTNKEAFAVTAKKKISDKWVHLCGMVTADKQLLVYIDGEPVASGRASALIAGNPLQATEIGADAGGAVGSYRSPNNFTGLIDEVRVYHAELTEDQVTALAAGNELDGEATPVLAFSFTGGEAKDESGGKNHGVITEAKQVKGQHGDALRFTGAKGGRSGGSLVQRDWTQDVPVFARAMVLADDRIVVAGPADLMNEEETFQQIVDGDADVDQLLLKQDAVLNGAEGGVLMIFSTETGETVGQLKTDSLPSWDGMAVAGGRIYMSTEGGTVVCYAAE